MGLNKYVIAATTFSIAMFACTIPVVDSALSADTKQQTQSDGEARACPDLREAMTALTRSRKELTEASQRVQGEGNKAAIQGVLNRTQESIKQTDSIMDKLQCSKT